jgi:hypothetical protein
MKNELFEIKKTYTSHYYEYMLNAKTEESINKATQIDTFAINLLNNLVIKNYIGRKPDEIIKILFDWVTNKKTTVEGGYSIEDPTDLIAYIDLKYKY